MRSYVIVVEEYYSPLGELVESKVVGVFIRTKHGLKLLHKLSDDLPRRVKPKELHEKTFVCTLSRRKRLVELHEGEWYELVKTIANSCYRHIYAIRVVNNRIEVDWGIIPKKEVEQFNDDFVSKVYEEIGGVVKCLMSMS